MPHGLPTRSGIRVLIAAIVLSATAYARNPEDVAPRKDYASVAKALEAFIEWQMQDKQLPSLSIALVDDQQIVWARGFGYADPDKKIPATAATVYRIGSVSKLFTDIGIMQMVEKGKIDLDAPVSTYIPEFKPDNQFGKPITLRQLMSHRSGLLRESPVGHYFDPTEPSLKDTVLSMNGLPLVYPPETRVKYSNIGVATVGYVLERMNGERFPAYLKKANVRFPGSGTNKQKEIEVLCQRLEALGGIPKTLGLEEQGRFALGYYCQLAQYRKDRAEDDAAKKAEELLGETN